jgi:hypothetical protein
MAAEAGALSSSSSSLVSPYGLLHGGLRVTGQLTLWLNSKCSKRAREKPHGVYILVRSHMVSLLLPLTVQSHHKDHCISRGYRPHLTMEGVSMNFHPSETQV